MDIEGAEQFIITDIQIFGAYNAAVWLSLHPPFIANKYLFLQGLLSLQKKFYIIDEDRCHIDFSKLSSQVLSKETKPTWGTKWRNFFEIGLLPKEFFNMSGNRK